MHVVFEEIDRGLTVLRHAYRAPGGCFDQSCDGAHGDDADGDGIASVTTGGWDSDRSRPCDRYCRD